jgi:hypothetical protein
MNFDIHKGPGTNPALIRGTTILAFSDFIIMEVAVK